MYVQLDCTLGNKDNQFACAKKTKFGQNQHVHIRKKLFSRLERKSWCKESHFYQKNHFTQPT